MSESGRRSSSRRRIVKLLCPSVSKQCVEEVVVSEDEKVDMGFISRFFGLDPGAATVKLNRHLIGSSSLTWKSLLSFFASRGFPTGSTDNNDPIIVHGKLYNSGTKRRSECLDTEKWDKQSTPQDFFSKRLNTELERANFFKKIKMEPNDAGICNPSNGKDGDCQTTRGNGLGLLKRKPSLEDNNPLKKSRIVEGSSGSEPGLSKSISRTQLGHRCISGNKRQREGEMIM
ncbi:hypothetical protein IFM89_034941 [Coptis chinensis]|uniref:Uncharacterized protein n=1 Tax=Coptis chinensis TaxID=261450 RepID=A0A835I9G3_9MAGN|nr:hypothetical protein IFM89_034941 [Coptis chinensis]